MVTASDADRPGPLTARCPVDLNPYRMGSRAWAHLSFSIVVDVAEDKVHQTGTEVVG
jgi:hypothetical protein